jgi:hypothetical protein
MCGPRGRRGRFDHREELQSSNPADARASLVFVGLHCLGIDFPMFVKSCYVFMIDKLLAGCDKGTGMASAPA